MKPPEREQLEQLFDAAIQRPTRAARTAFLDGACADDPQLRASVDALLAAHDKAEGFLDIPVSEEVTLLNASDSQERPGTMIGCYKILQLIGEGGFGAVYMAEQQEPVRRKVALKIIKLGMDTRQVIARFEAERQALALMDHPNIASVLDAGATATGRPYFVMELVKGISITEFCDRHKLNTRERLDLFIQACRAVQHAHQKGIIHRDIKPGNILVTLHDTVPVPMIIDFGIAKAVSHRLTEKTLFTEFRQFIGTPEYMSPDQADISGLDVDTRTDIYSLGVLLYELLTGSTPFDGKTLRKASYAELQRIIREQEPPKPSTRVNTLIDSGTDIAILRKTEPVSLSRLIRGDLDWIVMKAIEKDRTRRYDTAMDLANDVQRHLRNEPVLAGPPSLAYKASKFIRRNQAGVIAGSVVFLALVIGLVVSTTFYIRAVRERDLAVMARSQAAQEAYRTQAIADFLQDMLVSTDPNQAMGLDVDVATVAETAREVFGDDHATVAATLSSLAVQLQTKGDLDAAEPLHRESLRMWRNLYPQDDENVAIAQARLGTLLRIKGDDGAAEQCFRDALDIWRRLPDEGSVAAAGTMIELAEVLQNRGAHGEAVFLIRESIRIRQRIAPHQRFQIALTNNLLMRALLVQGDAASALDVGDSVIVLWRELLPKRGLTISKILVEFGNLHLQHGRLDKAESMFTEALEAYRHTAEKPMVFIRAGVGGMVHIHNERDDKTAGFISTRMKLIAMVRDILPDTEPYLGEVLIDHASYLRDRDRTAEGIDMALEGLRILRENGGDRKLIDRTMFRLQDAVWQIAKRADKSTGEYEAALRGATYYLEARPESVAVMNTRGALLYRISRYSDALDVLTRCDELNRAKHALGLPSDVAFLALTQHRMGRSQEAARALRRLREIMEDPNYGSVEENKALLAEAESLITGTPAPAASPGA